MLTSGLITGRILGSSKVCTVSTQTLVLSSGNNVQPIDDMTRRCITINLVSASEMPAQRSFSRPNLTEEVLSRREEYVSAALTVVTAWVHAGRPMSPGKPVASFGKWSDLCRQPILWLGHPDPASSIFHAIQKDPGRELLARLLENWHALIGSTPMAVRALLKHLNKLGDPGAQLQEVLEDIGGDRAGVNARRLGHWLKRHSNRPVGGKFLVAANQSSQSTQWAVRTI